MVFGRLPIPPNLVHHLDVLGQVRVEVVLDDLLYSVVGVQLEEQHEVYVVSACTIENGNVLHTEDAAHPLVASNTQHTQDLLVKLDTRHYIIKDRKKLILVVSVFVDILHILQDFGKVFRRL